jgi:UDPglucose 6-dehydrogenase
VSRVSVIGTGYVGLVTGACLAEKGHRVTCVDTDPEKVQRLNGGAAHLYERDLQPLLARNVPVRLRATTDLARAVRQTDISLITVGTPFNGTEIDLSQVVEVAREIGAALRRKAAYHAVVVKSTVVPGTTDEVVRPAIESAARKRAGRDFGLGVNPEFLREGEAVGDFMHPDRIIMGGVDDRTLDALDDLYRSFSDVEKLRTRNRTAEMIKYASNALFATMISFSNEIANVCARLEGVDVVDVMRGVHLDRRLNLVTPEGERVVAGFTTYLKAGCGFGGSCFPKDVKALIAHGRKNGVPMPLLEGTMRVNQAQPGQVMQLLRKHFPSLEGVSVAVLGLAFKPGTDDVRESPAIPVIADLRRGGARVRAFDPVVSPAGARAVFGADVELCERLEDVLDADAVVLVTEWQEFKRLPELLAGLDDPPLLVDGRRMLDKRMFARYEGIGAS